MTPAPQRTAQLWSAHRLVAVVVGLLLATLLLTPAVVAVLAAWGRPWVPAGDWAMLELAVSDMGTHATRLVGPYSRVGWSHPGPLLFWTLAPLWRVTGGATWSLLVGAALVNLASLAAVVALSWRRGRLTLLGLVTLGLVWVLAALDDGMLADPWNPWVGVLALTAVVLGVAGAIEGDGLAMVVAVVAGSLCAQAHVGYVPVVGALWLVGGLWAWRRSALTSPWWVWGAAVPLVVLWAPVAIDAVAGRGNLGDLLGGSSSGDPGGWSVGLGLVARQLVWGGPWMGGDEPVAVANGAVEGRPLGALVIPVVVFLVALGLGVWRRRGRAVRLQVVVGVAVAAGAMAVTRLEGPAFNYLVRWWWPLAALWWVSAAWTLWCVVGDGWRSSSVGRQPSIRWIPSWAPVVLGALVVVVAAPVAVDAAGRVGRHVSPNERFATVVTTTTDTTLDALGAPGRGEAGVVEVRSAGEGTGWVVDALGVSLERAGWEVVVPRTPVAEGKWGPTRTRAERELAWSAGSSVPPGGRRAVWVLADGDTPQVGRLAGAPRRVVEDPVGIDGVPFTVWVG